jgi:hypothetical protein
MNTSRFKIAFGILFLAGLFAACDEPRDLRTDTRTVAAGGAKTAEVDIRMGAGELRLSGAAQEGLLQATFRYNRDRLKPEVDYRVSGETGILRVGSRRFSGISFGRIRNEWDLSLSKALPVDLKVNLGAGESRLDLRGLDLSALDVDMGVGEMTLDLRGPHEKSIRVRIDGGVGSGTIYLPSEVGVRARVHGGIGSVSARGLSKEGRIYTNDVYGKSGVTIDVEISAGIGSLDLRVEPGDRVKI